MVVWFASFDLNKLSTDKLKIKKKIILMQILPFVAGTLGKLVIFVFVFVFKCLHNDMENVKDSAWAMHGSF